MDQHPKSNAGIRLLLRYHLWRARRLEARHNFEGAAVHLLDAVGRANADARPSLVAWYIRIREAARPRRIVMADGPCHIYALDVPEAIPAPLVWDQAFDLAAARRHVTVEFEAGSAVVTPRGRLRWKRDQCPPELLIWEPLAANTDDPGLGVV